MKISRLFEIVYILLNRKTVTAAELAEYFEVSLRTIYRDIDTLTEGGIPIYTSAGRNGGIGLTETFILNKAVLSETEQKEILSALEGMKGVSFSETDQVLKKMSELFRIEKEPWIQVDFSAWGQKDKDTFTLLKTAVQNQRIISFDYYNASCQHSNRQAEPVQLIFKGRAWYLKAYCLQAEAIRFFKISRMKHVLLTERSFDTRHVSKEDFLIDPDDYPTVEVTLRINADMAYRVYDEFEPEQIMKKQDGSFSVVICFPENAWLYGYILSYGESAQVQEPEWVKKIIKEKIENMKKTYENMT